MRQYGGPSRTPIDILRERRVKLSGKSETARAIDYSLKRWEMFTRFLDNGQLSMSSKPL
jgi:transposase